MGPGPMSRAGIGAGGGQGNLGGVSAGMGGGPMVGMGGRGSGLGGSGGVVMDAPLRKRGHLEEDAPEGSMAKSECTWGLALGMRVLPGPWDHCAGT